MRLAVIFIAACVCATPALAQDSLYPQTSSPNDGLRDNLARSFNLATQALRAQDFNTARKHGRELTRLNPAAPPAWLILGAAELGLRDWKAAQRTYAMAVRLEPSSVEAHGGLGVAMARSGDAKAAEQLAWLDAKAQTCRANCAPVIKFKTDVEAALNEARR